MIEAKDEERRQKAVRFWRIVFDALWNVSRLLVISLGLAALACINAIGNAGAAPDLLRFYTTIGGQFGKGWLIAIGVAGLAYFYRALDLSSIFTAPSKPLWYRLQMRLPWITHVEYVSGHIMLGCFLISVGLYFIVAAAPLPIIAKLSGEFGTALACDAEYRTQIASPNYRLTTECQNYLVKQNRLPVKPE